MDKGRGQGFYGADLDRERDFPRLKAQFQIVRDLMSDGNWRTLAEISKATDIPEASVSARLRNLRYPEFGDFVVQRRRRIHPQFEYRILSKSDPRAIDDSKSHQQIGIGKPGVTRKRKKICPNCGEFI